jgi:hypothetical protein
MMTKKVKDLQIGEKFRFHNKEYEVWDIPYPCYTYLENYYSIPIVHPIYGYKTTIQINGDCEVNIINSVHPKQENQLSKKKVKDLQVGDVFITEDDVEAVVKYQPYKRWDGRYEVTVDLGTKDLICQTVDADFEVSISQPFKGILPVNYDELQPNEELVTHTDIKVGDKCRFSAKINGGYAYPDKDGEYFTISRIENSKFTDKEVKLYGPTKYNAEDLISVGWAKSIIRYTKPYNYKELQKDEVFVNIEDVKVGDKIRCCDSDYPGNRTYYEVTYIKHNSNSDWYTLYSLGYTSGGGDSCGHGKRVMVKSVKKLDQTVLDIAAKLNISLTKEIEKEEIVKKMVKVTVDKTEQELRNEIKSKL